MAIRITTTLITEPYRPPADIYNPDTFEFDDAPRGEMVQENWPS